jgi:hypothetical protein
VRATFDEGNSDVRFYAGLTGPVAVNAMCYKCSNPACPGVLENMKDHNVSSSDDMTALARQYATTFVRKIQFQDCSAKVPGGTVEFTEACHTLR